MPNLEFLLHRHRLFRTPRLGSTVRCGPHTRHAIDVCRRPCSVLVCVCRELVNTNLLRQATPLTVHPPHSSRGSREKKRLCETRQQTAELTAVGAGRRDAAGVEQMADERMSVPGRPMSSV